MKRGIICIVLTITVIGVMWFRSPLYQYQNRPVVHTVVAESKNIYDSVLARGSVEEGISRKIRVDHAVQIDKIHAHVGDHVTEGEILFHVSQAKQPFPNAESVLSMLPELSENKNNALAVLSEISNYDDYEDILSQFYMSQNTEPTEDFTPEVHTPISGVITELSTKEGDIASSQSVLATVSDFNQLQVRVRVPELYIGNIAVGQSAEITGEAFSGKKYLGKVVKISPTAKQKGSLTGAGETTVDVLLSIDTKNNVLRPGYSVSAKIYTDSRKDAVVVPYSCVWQDESEKEFVYVEKDGIIYKKAIRTGFELDDEIEIRDGVKQGENVVLEPSAAFTSGIAVRTQEGK